VPDVRAFIHAHIHSVEQLEVLLLLRRERARSFTGKEIANELRIHPDSAEQRLSDLEDRGLAGRDGERFSYAPANGELERCVNGLAAAYADARVSVIQTIFSKPQDPLKNFADAFKLKGKP
jgi:hypothetical protein